MDIVKRLDNWIADSSRALPPFDRCDGPMEVQPHWRVMDYDLRCMHAYMEKQNAEIERLRIQLAGCKLALTHPHGEIGVGNAVEKVTGYLWPGEVRSVFTTIKGEIRYVVECTVPKVAGALHIYSGQQIERKE